jgi:hypothetical protein
MAGKEGSQAQGGAGQATWEEQSKYKGQLIKIKQEHHQHHHQPLIKASTGARYNRTCLSMTKSLQASGFLNKINSKKESHTTKPFYQVQHLGGFGEVFLLRLTERCSV